MNIPSPGAYDYIADASSFGRTLSSVCQKIPVISGEAITQCKKGFLSCLNSVTNSLIGFTRAIFSGSRGFKVSGSSGKTSEVNKVHSVRWAPRLLRSVSANRIEEVCQETMIAVQNNRNNANGMFRICLPSGRADELNALLREDITFATRVKEGEISPAEVSIISKLWSNEIMAGRRFTPAEARLLVEHKADKERVVELLENKFDLSDTEQAEDLYKLKIIFAFYNNFREICRADKANEPESPLEYNEKTLLTCIEPRIFDDIGQETSLIAITQNTVVSKAAFLSLLNAYDSH
ncbi:hypothetical protein ACQYRI_04665 [Salmonella enterica]